MSHELWDLWKEGRFYKVQFPKGIATFGTKKVALQFIEAFSLVRNSHLKEIA